MAKFSHHKKISKDIVFPIFGIFLAVIIAGFAIYSMTFLVSHINDALNTPVKAGDQPSFDIQGFEKLNLIQK